MFKAKSAISIYINIVIVVIMIYNELIEMSTISYGRTTIPKEVRELLGLQNEDKIIFQLEYNLNKKGERINKKIIVRSK